MRVNDMGLGFIFQQQQEEHEHTNKKKSWTNTCATKKPKYTVSAYISGMYNPTTNKVRNNYGKYNNLNPKLE